MLSIYVPFHEFLKKDNGIEENEIDSWWTNVILKNIPENIRSEAEEKGFKLEKDSTFDHSSTLSQRFVISIPDASSSLQKFLQDNGPFIVIVSAT